MSEIGILVIGNGFDLYHGLPTRYTDFLELIKNWDVFYNAYGVKMMEEPPKENIDIANKLSKDSICDLVKYAKLFNHENIEKLNRIISADNSWINYFVNSGYEKDGWIDFEMEMEKILLMFEEKFRNSQTTEQLSVYFGKYFSPIYHQINAEYDNDSDSRILRDLKGELDEFITALNIFFSEFIDKASIKPYSNQIAQIPVDNIINFNYTNTYQKVYRDNTNTHHIHGEIDKDNMVLGIKDNIVKDSRFVYFKKFFQRIQKRTGLQYKQWINRNSPISIYNKFYVIGHSLDETDGDIFRNIISSSYTKQVIFYNHRQEAYESQIINLIKILGKNDFLEKYESKKIMFEQLEQY